MRLLTRAVMADKGCMPGKEPITTKQIMKDDLQTFGALLFLLALVGVPLAALYVLVRFVHWAWMN